MPAPPDGSLPAIVSTIGFLPPAISADSCPRVQSSQERIVLNRSRHGSSLSEDVQCDEEEEYHHLPENAQRQHDRKADSAAKQVGPCIPKHDPALAVERISVH